MSWWISLECEACGSTVKVESHSEGGTYCVGGTDRADLNVTYNYGGHFPFKSLHEKMAKETIDMLEEAVERLGIERDQDYWAKTPGNAGYACSILLGWAKQHPEAIWRVD
jgi:hypothetical protein